LRNPAPLSWSLDRDTFESRAILNDERWQLPAAAFIESAIRVELRLGMHLHEADFSAMPAGVVSTPLESPRVRTIGCSFVERPGAIDPAAWSALQGPGRNEQVIANSGE